MCPTPMTLGLGGARPPPCPHTPLIPHGARAVWGRGGGRAPPRPSIMGVGHIHVPHPHPHAPTLPSPPYGMRGACVGVDMPYPHAALLMCGVGWAKPACKPPLPLPPLATHPRVRGEEGGMCVGCIPRPCHHHPPPHPPHRE